MLLCPVSHICDGQKTCFSTIVLTSFFAHEITDNKPKVIQNTKFQTMRQFLNRAVINGLNIPLQFMQNMLNLGFSEVLNIWVPVLIRGGTKNKLKYNRRDPKASAWLG